MLRFTTRFHVAATPVLAVAAILAAAARGEAQTADDPTAVVGSYEVALDRMVQELVVTLEHSPALLIWCFDESESMKDDQREISERLNRLYSNLGRVAGLADDALLMAVTSYGADFHLQTPQPTGNVDELRDAIAAVPIDVSGKELMCSAIGRAVVMGRKWSLEDKRRVMIIVVTDESGDPADNRTKLEAAIDEANASKSRVYFFGREANFGYPFGYLRWRHPQTRRIHWLQTDRGPETAFVQTLQSDGFGPRRDAFASGFGPYTQMRLVRETGGVFFMLPSLETAMTPPRQAPYKLEAMRRYRPDWRPRAEIMADRDRDPLRSQLCQVIDELNPRHAKTANTVLLRTSFSLQGDELRRQVTTEGDKVEAYLERLVAAEKSLEALLDRRAAEQSARWQANYDLMLAQLVSYQARVHAYRGCLDEFVENPSSAPPTRSSKLHLASWRVTTVRGSKVLESARLGERATDLLRQVIQNHPETPWARMADWELKRGFGIALRPYYAPKPVRLPNPIPVPKL